MPKGRVHKLSLLQKKKALKLYNDCMSLGEIGRRYKVSKETIDYWLGQYAYRKSAYRFVSTKTEKGIIDVYADTELE